jgi:hypothetical protein
VERKPYTVTKKNAWESLKGNQNSRKRKVAPLGMSRHPMYSIYYNMVARCTNPNHPKYRDYGERGIKVCDRWLEPDGQGFLNFLNDVGERPEGKLLSGHTAYTLDRENNNGNYEPGNVRWADHTTQRHNQRLPEEMEKINNPLFQK